MKNFQTLFETSALTSGIRETYKVTHSGGYGMTGLSDVPRPRDGNAKPVRQISELTAREREVLQLVAAGKLNKEAASELCISVKTVEKHRGKLMEKLGIHGTASLTRYAIATGIVPCNP